MSYILDALKRSQQERASGEVPTLLTDEPPPARRESRDTHTAFSLLPFLLIGAALLAGLYLLNRNLPSGNDRPLQPDPLTPLDRAPGTDAGGAGPRPGGLPEAPLRSDRGVVSKEGAGSAATPAEAPGPAAPAVKTASAAAPAEPERQRPVHPETGREPADNQLADTTAIAAMRRELLDIRRQLQVKRSGAESKPAERSETGKATAAPVDAGRPEPATPLDSVPGPEQALSPEVRRRLPARRITVLAYSPEPDRRFIILNSKKMREGERSGEGLLLEAILKDGVIFSFEQHRFFSSVYP